MPGDDAYADLPVSDRLVVPGLFDLPLSRLRDAYEGALPHALGELA